MHYVYRKEGGGGGGGGAEDFLGGVLKLFEGNRGDASFFRSH